MLLGVWDGFLNPTEESLSSVSKLGGLPVYMPPNADTIASIVRPLATCGVCGDPMFLLLQCYCPLPNDEDENFNRMKYVFCCNNATCALQPERSWVSINVTSSTFDEAAERGEGEAGEEEDDVEEMPGAAHHIPPFSFPSAGIDVIDEPEKAVVKLDEREQHLMAEFERKQLRQRKIAEMRARGEEPDEKELLEAGLSREDAEDMEKEIDLKNKASDVAYDKFRRRVERCPKQVIRYQYKGQPIFMNPARIKDVKVPACGRCGGPQTMELQIMPTVIFLLRTSEYVAASAGAGGEAEEEEAEGSAAAAAATADVSSEVKAAVRAAGEGVDFASVTCYQCANPNCGNDYSALFEEKADGAETEKEEEKEGKSNSASAASSNQSVLVSKGSIGGAADGIRFNIRKDFLLVEGAPDLDEELQAQEHQAQNGGGEKDGSKGANGPLRPKSLREIMFAPMPADEAVDEDDDDEEKVAVDAGHVATEPESN